MTLEVGSQANRKMKKGALLPNAEHVVPFLKFATLHFISAKKRQGLGPLWGAIAQAHKAAMCKMSRSPHFCAQRDGLSRVWSNHEQHVSRASQDD